MQQHVKLLPTNRKVVSADGDSLGPAVEVHVKFKLGKVEFNDVFIILNNLQWDIILSLLWQHNYRIGCTWNRGGKHFLTIKNKFLALSIAQQAAKQLVIIKGQCTLQSRSITWISVKMPGNIQVNNLFENTLDQQLHKRLIPLDVLHNIQHKQPQEMLISLLNTMNSVVKLPKNTCLGSIIKLIMQNMSRTYAHCSLTMTRHMTGLSLHWKQSPYFQCSRTAPASTHMHTTATSHQYNYKMQVFY